MYRDKVVNGSHADLIQTSPMPCKRMHPLNLHKSSARDFRSPRYSHWHTVHAALQNISSLHAGQLH